MTYDLWCRLMMPRHPHKCHASVLTCHVTCHGWGTSPWTFKSQLSFFEGATPWMYPSIRYNVSIHSFTCPHDYLSYIYTVAYLQVGTLLYQKYTILLGKEPYICAYTHKCMLTNVWRRIISDTLRKIWKTFGDSHDDCWTVWVSKTERCFILFRLKPIFTITAFWFGFW